ncbi:hypothetical protein R4Z10_04150 [Niallia sp. XMNu-256]
MIANGRIPLRRKGIESGIDNAVPVIKVDKKRARLTVDRAIILKRELMIY